MAVELRYLSKYGGVDLESDYNLYLVWILTYNLWGRSQKTGRVLLKDKVTDIEMGEDPVDTVQLRGTGSVFVRTSRGVDVSV